MMQYPREHWEPKQPEPPQDWGKILFAIFVVSVIVIGTLAAALMNR